MKKDYLKPEMAVIQIKSKPQLLVGSAAEASNFRNGGNIWEDENYENE